MEQHIKNFLHYLKIEKGVSDNTITNYRYYIRCFLELTKVASPQKIDADTISLLREKLHEKKLSKKSVNYHLIGLRALLNYFFEKNIESYDARKVKLAKVGKQPIEILSVEEAKSIFEAQKNNKRNYAIFLSLYSTGLRISELYALPRDLALRDEGCAVQGKGEKVRLVFFSEEAKKAIADYLITRTDTDPKLFPGAKRNIQKMIATTARKLKIKKKVSAHSFRHLFASSLIASGTPLHYVQNLLGHSSIATTSVYLHANNLELQNAHKKLPTI